MHSWSVYKWNKGGGGGGQFMCWRTESGSSYTCASPIWAQKNNIVSINPFYFFRLQSHLGQKLLPLTRSLHPSTHQIHRLYLLNIPQTFPLLSIPLSLAKCRSMVGHIGQGFGIGSEWAVFKSQFMLVAVWSRASYLTFQNFSLHLGNVGGNNNITSGLLQDFWDNAYQVLSTAPGVRWAPSKH